MSPRRESGVPYGVDTLPPSLLDVYQTTRSEYCAHWFGVSQTRAYSTFRPASQRRLRIVSKM